MKPITENHIEQSAIEILQSQAPCPKNMDFKRYVEDIESISWSTNVLFIMKIKGNDNKIKRYLISSRDFADLLKLKDSYIDTSLPRMIKKAMLGENLNFNFNSKLNNYLIPEHMYEKYQKKSPSSVYKKYFDKEGHQKGNPVYFYTWGEYPAMLSYLIDYYAVIHIHDYYGILVWSKPCRCKSSD